MDYLEKKLRLACRNAENMAPPPDLLKTIKYVIDPGPEDKDEKGKPFTTLLFSASTNSN